MDIWTSALKVSLRQEVVYQVDLSSGYYQFMVNKLVGRLESFSSFVKLVGLCQIVNLIHPISLNARFKTRSVC